MEKTLELRIITPQRVVYTGTVENFTAPGVMGPFQVLYHHAPIVSKLQAGLLSVKEPSGAKQNYFVSGGFLELHNNIGSVLADSIEEAKDINIPEAEAEIARLHKRYADHETGYTPDVYHAELDVAMARLNAAKHA